MTGPRERPDAGGNTVGNGAARAMPGGRRRVWGPAAATAACALLVLGCDARQLAVRMLADALARTGDTYAADDDPELVGDALPFALKLIESLLVESPRHRGLLSAACSGFTQYAYAFVQQRADELEPVDLSASLALRERARRLYRRARDYGLRGLDAVYGGIAERLRGDPAAALARVRRDDVDLVYWTAAAWGSLISNSRDDPDLIADQPIVEALIDRALVLDETYADGAIHAFLVSYEPARPGAAEPAEVRARRHFERAVAASGGQSAAPLVAFAENVSVQRQDRREFRELIERALAVDVDARPRLRLMNLIMQRRARWLLSREDELFVE